VNRDAGAEFLRIACSEIRIGANFDPSDHCLCIRRLNTRRLRGHVAVKQIDVARKARVEEGGLIRGGFAAPDQRTPPRCSIFLKLFAQSLEGQTRQSCNAAAKAVQNIALEKLPGARRQLIRQQNLRGVERPGAFPLPARWVSVRS
jgi:hypothetical protein